MYLKLGGMLGLLWVVGMLFGYKLGGAIYLVLAAAAISVCYGLVQWFRKPA
jgi:hypothetical protein